MSDQRTNTDERVDPRVSAAYRELADERTPEHLDHVILNAARSKMVSDARSHHASPDDDCLCIFW